MHYLCKRHTSRRIQTFPISHSAIAELLNVMNSVTDRAAAVNSISGLITFGHHFTFDVFVTSFRTTVNSMFVPL